MTNRYCGCCCCLSHTLLLLFVSHGRPLCSFLLSFFSREFRRSACPVVVVLLSIVCWMLLLPPLLLQLSRLVIVSLCPFAQCCVQSPLLWLSRLLARASNEHKGSLIILSPRRVQKLSHHRSCPHFLLSRFAFPSFLLPFFPVNLLRIPSISLSVAAPTVAVTRRSFPRSLRPGPCPAAGAPASGGGIAFLPSCFFPVRLPFLSLCLFCLFVCLSVSLSVGDVVH